MNGTKEQSSGESEKVKLMLFSKAEEIVVKKGYMKSVFWKWFDFLKGDEAQTKDGLQNMSLVNACEDRKHDQLVRHLKRWHSIDYTENMKMEGQSSVSPPPTAVSVVQCPSTSIIAINVSGSPAFSRASETAARQQSIMSPFAAMVPYEKQSKRSRDITCVVSYYSKRYDAY